MRIEDEIADFLRNNLRELTTRKRDIELISYYYGFRNASWPTLEETALAFGIGSRERVRQVLENKFKSIANTIAFPCVQRCAGILSSRLFHAASNFTKELEEAGLVQSPCNVQGIFNLLHDLNFADSYDVYTPDLKKVTRKKLNSCEEMFLIDSNLVEELKRDLKKVKTLPGQLGIANLEDLSGIISNWTLKKQIFIALIEKSPKVWFKSYDTDYWYMFEERVNVLINYSEKVFSKIPVCSKDQIVKAYRNALDKKTPKIGSYPSEVIISEYLNSSVFFEVRDSKIKFNGDLSSLTDIENDLFTILSETNCLSFPELKSKLKHKGYGTAYVDKSVLHSPLVFVDKNAGRAHYKYSLLTAVDFPILDESESRYEDFRRKLTKLLHEGTDQDLESKGRREHAILRDWLKSGKTQEQCAICSKTYGIEALVAAHKKDRSVCTESERLDPHIVMLVCNFGCDYLYGRRLVYIEDGKVKISETVSGSTEEFNAARALDGNSVPEQWLEGNQGYFTP